MAPALTSHSFRLNSDLRLKSKNKNPKPTTTVIYAKQNPFGFGKAKENSSEGEAGAEALKISNPFNFDFAKAQDVRSLIPVVTSPSTTLFQSRGRKDPQTVFVAGATGQTGIRIAQTLLRQGYTVRAGVPDLSAAQELARVAATYKIISPAESKRLNAVESSSGEPEAIAKAIGPAAKVVVTIGPAEKGPTAEVTTDDALQVVRAAELAGVGHVTVVYDAGYGGSTYNVLDGITSFFNNLFARSQQLTLTEFLSKVVETEVSYTLIKTSLSEDYSEESSYGLVVSEEGSTVGTQAEYSKVSKSQIAAFVADVFSNTSVAENKVVEVSSSPSAASKPIVEIFSTIPEDGRRKAYQEALAKAKAEEEALIASKRAREAAEAAKKLEKEVKKLSEKEAQAASLAEEARERAEAAGSSLENILNRAKGFSGDFSWEKLSSQLAIAVAQNPDNSPIAQLATIRGQAKAQSLPRQKAVIKPSPQKPKPSKQTTPKPKQTTPKPEVKKAFGGLFKQETIYIDDD